MQYYFVFGSFQRIQIDIDYNYSTALEDIFIESLRSLNIAVLNLSGN